MSSDMIDHWMAHIAIQWQLLKVVGMIFLPAAAVAIALAAWDMREKGGA